MKIVKNVQSTHISDDFTNHYIISFLEQILVYSTLHKDVIDYFFKMKDGRGKKSREVNTFAIGAYFVMIYWQL